MNSAVMQAEMSLIAGFGLSSEALQSAALERIISSTPYNELPEDWQAMIAAASYSRILGVPPSEVENLLTDWDIQAYRLESKYGEHSQKR